MMNRLFPTVARGARFSSDALRSRLNRRVTGALILVCIVWYSANYFSAEQKAIRRAHDLEIAVGTADQKTPLLWLGRKSLVNRFLMRLTQRVEMQSIEGMHRAVTDGDVGLFVAGFPNCPRYHLTSSRITDAALRQLATVPTLEEVWIEDTAVTDAGMSELETCRHLSFVRLDGTRITDNGLRRLAGLPSLRRLGISRTDVTDQGLAHLTTASAMLRYVDVSETRVTDAGVAALQAAHPNCTIVR